MSMHGLIHDAMMAVDKLWQLIWILLRNVRAAFDVGVQERDGT
jgi:hypothetical protein